MHSGILSNVLCGFPRSLPAATAISGEGKTFVSEIFSIISQCGSSLNKDLPTSEAIGSKFEYTNISGLALHSCLLLATIAQSFKSAVGNSAALILTTSSEIQQSRLSSLACLFSFNDGAVTSLQPHCASAMLAFASIILIESGASVNSSVINAAMPFFPCMSFLCDLFKMNNKDKLENTCNATNYMLSHGHGLKDGCVGLLKSKLRWERQIASKQFCASGLPKLLWICWEKI